MHCNKYYNNDAVPQKARPDKHSSGRGASGRQTHTQGLRSYGRPAAIMGDVTMKAYPIGSSRRRALAAAALLLGGTALTAPALAQDTAANTTSSADDSGRQQGNRRHRLAGRPADHRCRLDLRLRQDAGRNAALGIDASVGRADRTLRHHRHLRPRRAGAGYVHQLVLRRRRRARYSRHAGRSLFPRACAGSTIPATIRPRSAASDAHRHRARPGLADLRSVKDRRLHELRAQVGARVLGRRLSDQARRRD